jgi:hypothetical protein
MIIDGIASRAVPDSARPLLPACCKAWLPLLGLSFAFNLGENPSASYGPAARYL